MKKQVMKLAWSLFKLRIINSFTNALKAAWTILKIKAGRVVKFAYTKKDESYRVATSIPVPVDYEYKNTGHAEPPINIVRYFDADAMGWRSFDVARLI